MKRTGSSQKFNVFIAFRVVPLNYLQRLIAIKLHSSALSEFQLLPADCQSNAQSASVVKAGTLAFCKSASWFRNDSHNAQKVIGPDADNIK